MGVSFRISLASSDVWIEWPQWTSGILKLTPDDCSAPQPKNHPVGPLPHFLAAQQSGHHESRVPHPLATRPAGLTEEIEIVQPAWP